MSSDKQYMGKQIMFDDEPEPIPRNKLDYNLTYHIILRNILEVSWTLVF